MVCGWMFRQSYVALAGIPCSASILQIDRSCVLHPFTLRKLDVGPIQLMTIAHTFNYRMAVLRDGVRLAVRIGRSRKAEGRFLTDTDLSWGQQVAVMFQIISTLALEFPSFLEGLADIRGASPDVQLDYEPWGQMDHSEGHCSCRSSDRMAAYVHELGLMSKEDGGGGGVAMTYSTGTNEWSGLEPCLEMGRPVSVPFVSDRPGAYGRLLLSVYVRWRTRVLVPSDWLTPVTRGGWQTGFPERVHSSVGVS